MLCPIAWPKILALEYTNVKYSFKQAFLALRVHASVNGLIFGDKLMAFLSLFRLH